MPTTTIKLRGGLPTLNRLGQVQVKGSTKDGHGHNVDTWSNYPDKPRIPVALAEESGFEVLRAQKQWGNNTHVLNARWHPWLSIEHRIVINDLTLQVVHIENVAQQGSWSRVTATEVL